MNIAPHEKLYAITLIPLKGVAASYEHILVVNDRDESIIAEDNYASDPELKDFKTLLNHPLVIFTNNDCTRCQTMVALLNQKHTEYKLINVDELKRYHDALEILLQIEDDTMRSVKLPVVRKKGEMIYPIWNVKKMAKDLSEEFPVTSH